ncbi:MAG: outer membrane beta-barrel protein [Bacteroidetes bacterium]|nr:outer membrane beta-barrel protein [Bacteroidota bacterium]
MSQRFSIPVLLVFSLLIPFRGMAQAPLEAGVYLGAVNYLGDLAEQVTFVETNAAYGVYTRWNPIKKLGIKTSLLAGRLSGDDRNSPRLIKRAFRFSTPFWSANLQLEIIPLARRSYVSPLHFKGGVQPYLTGGIGYTYANTVVDYSESPVEALKTPFPEPGDISTFFNTSFGGGLRLDLWEHWSIIFEGNWWYVYSDLLDGVSLNGRSDRNDWYITAGVMVSYHFGGRTICPSF